MFELQNPDLLHLLWALLLQALVLAVYWGWRQRTLQRLGSPALAERLLKGFSSKRFWLKNVLFGLSLALIVIAIADPRRPELRTPESRQSADVLIALDISQSMLARDAAPSRLEQAKNFIQKLVQTLEGERLGLIFFAGEAYAQMPLSTDAAALMMFARNAETDFVTDQGTDLAAAIELAVRLSETDSEAGRALVIISDGENFAEENPVKQARQARSEGLIIHAIGVGTEAGATIPLGGGAFKRDFTGQLVRTSANGALLQEIARAGGGIFAKTDDDEAAASIAREVGRLQKTAVQARSFTEYVPYFQWFVLPALLLLCLEQVLWWRRNNE